MKLPFSYRKHFFKPVLLSSFLGHALVVGTGSFVFRPPEFSVQKSPVSMELILLEEKPKKEDKKSPDLWVAKDASTRIRLTERPRKKQEARPQKSIRTPHLKGAQTESSPRYLNNPAPVYPALAREEGWEGTVILKVHVGSEGEALQISLERSSGYSILDQAALKAVRKWQFSPARAGSVSFSSWIRIPVRFILVEEA